MQLSSYIDHTILKADATSSDVKKLCEEAKKFNFASVCVNSCFASLVTEELKGSNVKTCCVVGFPLGATTTESKVFETLDAIKKGATEIDMVINVGATKEKKYDFVYEDIKQVVDVSKDKAKVKVIFETCLLTDEEKIKVCELCVKAGADFVKTSTGFNNGGATLEDIKLMKKAVNGKALVKASGGVRTKEDAEAMISAGADRIGTSNGIAIVS